MTSSLLERIGDWNPQLYRELKGRLKRRPVLMATGTSLVGQMLLVLYYLMRLPPLDRRLDGFNRYCLLRNSEDYCTVIRWHEWWQDLNYHFYGVLPFILILGGIYLLMSDLAKEKRRGTLDFIRLSPQSSDSFLIGKLLGVPVLLYLAVALTVPLHFFLGMAAEVHWHWFLKFYLLQAASCAFFYSAASLYAFMGFTQWWAGAPIVGIYLWVVSRKLNMTSCGSSPRYWIPRGDYYLAGFGFLLFAYLLWTYWNWQGLSRRFHNPSATILSKKQSYGATACFEVLLFGLIMPQLPDIFSKYELAQIIAVLNLLWFLGLIAAMSHHRQILQDWARFSYGDALGSVPRRTGVPPVPIPGKDGKKSQQNYSQQDWIWGEKSPAPVAIAINLLIAAAAFVPWILLWPSEMQKLPAIGSIIFSISLVSIYALLAQLMLLAKTKKRALWAFGSVAGAILLPSILCLMLSPEPRTMPLLWLFFFPFAGLKTASAAEIVLAGLVHFAILAAVSLRLMRELNRLGESAFQAASNAPRIS